MIFANPLVKLIRAFIFLALITCIACNQKSADNAAEKAIDPSVVNNPATASSANSKENVPVFQFESDTHDFGTITEGEKISFAFKFKNIGKADLLIRSANGSCGCTVPEFPKDPIAPGEGGIINVTFNSEGKVGEQHKTVTLISNTMPNNYVINIKGKVEKKN